MNRRTLFKLLGLHTAALTFPLHAQKPARSAHKQLILIELKGGNDGLNTVVPYADPHYYKLRPKIALPKNKLLHLNDHLALHPSMKGMKNIFDKGELGIIQGVGYPQPNRSHFRSIEIWDTASNAVDYLDNGWLDTLNSHQNKKLKGVVLGGNYGPLLGMNQGIIQINNIQRFLNHSKRIKAHLYMTGNNDALTHLLKTETEIRKSADLLEQHFYKKNSIPFPFKKSNFGRQLNIVSKLIDSDVNIPYYKLSLGSFDTHFNQNKKHAQLLKQLSEGISTLRQNLIKSGKWEDTLIMTYSEFGRRAGENASKGTDHGTAAAHFVIGGTVKGGIYGEQPALDALDKNGDLIHTTDFRSLYHSVSKEWMGSSSERLDMFPLLSFLKK